MSIAFALILFANLSVAYADESRDVRRLVSDAREVDRDIRSVVADFDFYYKRAYEYINASSSIKSSYEGSVVSLRKEFNDILIDYKPSNVNWGHQNVMRYHKIDTHSKDSMEDFVALGDDILDELDAQLQSMRDLAINIEKAYQSLPSNTTQVYRTYYYTHPYYYRSRTPYYYKNSYYRYNHPYYYRHKRSGGYGGVGFYFRIK